jgi:hypothetical protein
MTGDSFVTGINTHIGSTTTNRAIDQFDAIRSAAPKSEIALRSTQAKPLSRAGY